MAMSPRVHAARVALLLGNNAYGPPERVNLVNPWNDVKELETALRKLKFDVTTIVDLEQRSMKVALREFGSKAKNAEVALFYYSGHGVQAGGKNYLIPIKANIAKEEDLEIDAVLADWVLTQMKDAKVAIVILDACRDNPYIRKKGAAKGLARMSGYPDSMIAFSTDSDMTAPDNGQYAQILASEIVKPGAELVDVFRETRRRVAQQSNNKQQPTFEHKISERVYLAGQSAAQATEVARSVRPYFFWVTSGPKGLDGAIGQKWNWGDVEGKAPAVWESLAKQRYCPDVDRVKGFLVRDAPGNCCGNKQYLLLCFE